MKRIVLVLVGVVAVLSVMALMPTVSHASGSIVKLIPAESQLADTSGARFVAAPSKHYMDVAESQLVDTSGARFVAAQSKHYMDVAESQKVDISIDNQRSVAKTPWDFWEKSN